MKLLVANRGEIAARIVRAARESHVPVVAVYAADDAESLAARLADESIALAAAGPPAYLDGAALVAAARAAGCDAIHPGYGFLSESAAFAALCQDAGIAFVGPSAETLALFGDKVRARAFARETGVPVPEGTSGAVSLEEARAFYASLGAGAAVMIKASAGGGGRGMREVRRAEDLDAAYERARSEARMGFDRDDVYVERLFEGARHVEVQIVGDGTDATHLWERDCSLQRRNQKLIEIAPAPGLPRAMRRALLDAALALARGARIRGLATVEFLVRPDGFVFIETNPRLQVEHTVTEAVTGLDLVRLQLRIAAGATLAELGLDAEHAEPRGYALQARVNAERTGPDGAIAPARGTLRAFSLPTGPGVRIDTAARAGDATNPGYDSLLAKVVVHAPDADYGDAVAKLGRALAELEIDGVATNLELLRAILREPEVAAGPVATSFVTSRLPALVAAAAGADEATAVARAARAASDATANGRGVAVGAAAGAPSRGAGASAEPPLRDGVTAVRSPLDGRIASVAVREGDVLAPGAVVAIVEAMKMEHVVACAHGGTVVGAFVAAGDAVEEGRLLAAIDAASADAASGEAAGSSERGERPEFAAYALRRASTLDAARPEAMAKRRERGGRSARENVADLLDGGALEEYGAFAVPAQRRRRSLEDLVASAPADGLITGVGDVNAAAFPAERTRVAVAAYDYTVLAGTQGAMNHKKTDRIIEVARRDRLPFVLFAEGGGGRPGDTDALAVGGLDLHTFSGFASLGTRVPRVGIAAGRCFAGNAALFGMCDVTIATANANVGMGGPAMIEGGGLGVVAPEAIGPIAVQRANGVIDIAVADEAEATAAAKRVLAYAQGRTADWTCADQAALRDAVPRERRRAYDVRAILATLADAQSVCELGRDNARGMLTAFARIEGRPLGVIANDAAHGGGAILAAGAEKAARFLRLCDKLALPVLTLCDTPGIMVGPAAEETGLVRKAAGLFEAAAAVRVPIFTIVLRRGYGLGAMAMAGGGFHAGVFTVAWPTGEFGAMGLEGAIRLGFRKELAAIADPAERAAKYERMVAKAYENGAALNTASYLEIDDVIDPADSRRWALHGLRSAERG